MRNGDRYSRGKDKTRCLAGLSPQTWSLPAAQASHLSSGSAVHSQATYLLTRTAISTWGNISMQIEKLFEVQRKLKWLSQN